MSTVPPSPYLHPGPPPALPERPEGAPPPRRRPEGELPGWAPWTAFVVVLSALVAATVLGAIIIIPFATGGDDAPPGALIAATLVQDVIFIAMAVLFARMWRTPRPGDFGLRRAPFWRSLGLVVAVYLAFITFAALWTQLLDVQQEQEVLDDLGVKDSTFALLGGMLVVCILAPVAEEFLFRGYVFTALRNWRGLWPAAIVSGLIFGGIHIGSSPIAYTVPLAVFGVGLALLYAWTKSLYPCIVLHAINNSIAFSVDQDWSWQVPVVIVSCCLIAVLIARGIALVLDRGADAGADAGAPAVAH